MSGESEAGAWRWELRSVNARGLEIRFRTPGGFEAAERDWRTRIGSVFARGSVSASLNLDERSAARMARLDPVALDAAIDAVKAVEAASQKSGLALAPISAADLLAMRGVYEADNEPSERAESPAPERRADIDAGFEAALEALAGARAAEGGRLRDALAARLDEIDRLTAAAEAAWRDRQAAAPDYLAERVAALLKTEIALEPDRLAQEAALLAVRADVSEELDRLRAHVAGGRALLDAPPPAGRKLDFLSQEFNREANTLCAKSQDRRLTETGLALKVAIDQLREQSANVE